MRRQHLARRVSILLVLVLAVVTLSSCGTGKVSAPSYQYDASRYTLCTEIEGTQFLVPRELDDAKEDMENYSLYDDNELPKHSFEEITENHYYLIKPGTYGCYAYFVGNIDHVEGERDVTRLPSIMGFSSMISLQPRNGESFRTKADPKTGYIRNTFPVMIHDNAHDLNWYGYLTLLKNPNTGDNYALVDGAASKNQLKLAKYFADSFVMVDQKS